jgi:hypothetical protein
MQECSEDMQKCLAVEALKIEAIVLLRIIINTAAENRTRLLK